MTPTDRRRQLQVILDHHDDLARSLRRTTEMIATSQEQMDQAGHSLRDATQGLREAIDGMLAANKAALALYNDNDA